MTGGIERLADRLSLRQDLEHLDFRSADMVNANAKIYSTDQGLLGAICTCGDGGQIPAVVRLPDRNDGMTRCHPATGRVQDQRARQQLFRHRWRDGGDSKQVRVRRVVGAPDIPLKLRDVG